MSNRLVVISQGQGFLYDLSRASKMLFFILVSVARMAAYDHTFLFLAVGLLSIYLFYLVRFVGEIFLSLLRLLDRLLSLIY